MEAQHHHLNRCSCWDATTVKLIIEHCPSMNELVRVEIDKIIQFAQKNTNLPRYGKVHFTELSEAKLNVSSLPAEADASSIPPAQ